MSSLFTISSSIAGQRVDVEYVSRGGVVTSVIVVGMLAEWTGWFTGLVIMLGSIVGTASQGSTKSKLTLIVS